MFCRMSLVATTAIVLSGAGAVAAELPTFEIMGFPLTQHQLTAADSALVQERAPVPTLMLAGMPASPVQILVVTPRPKQEFAARSGRPAHD